MLTCVCPTDNILKELDSNIMYDRSFLNNDHFNTKGDNRGMCKIKRKEPDFYQFVMRNKGFQEHVIVKANAYTKCKHEWLAYAMQTRSSNYHGYNICKKNKRNKEVGKQLTNADS